MIVPPPPRFNHERMCITTQPWSCSPMKPRASFILHIGTSKVSPRVSSRTCLFAFTSHWKLQELSFCTTRVGITDPRSMYTTTTGFVISDFRRALFALLLRCSIILILVIGAIMSVNLNSDIPISVKQLNLSQIALVATNSASASTSLSFYAIIWDSIIRVARFFEHSGLLVPWRAAGDLSNTLFDMMFVCLFITSLMPCSLTR